MSAWIVLDSTINAIVQGIEDSGYRDTIGGIFRECDAPYSAFRVGGTEGEKLLRKLAFDLHAMNVAAVNVRYGDNVVPSVAGTTPAGEVPTFSGFKRSGKPVSPIQLYKHLQCLRYQCGEGEIDTTPLFLMLTRMIHAQAKLIVESMPEYEAARWE